MAVYFFTDTGSIQQTSSQGFGPKASALQTQYRVTSMFSGGTQQKAYAVCKGEILVLDNGGSYNVVLKPLSNYGWDYPIRYFIYKGIKKTALVSGQEIAARTMNDLTRVMHETQERRNALIDETAGNPQGTTTAKPQKSALGLDLTLSGSESLDSVFNLFTSDQLPIVEAAGDHIGDFESSAFGFEVVLHNDNEGPLVSDAKTLEKIVSVQSGSNAREKFIEQDERHKVLDYMDPCAFYSQFYFLGFRKKGSANRIAKASLFQFLNGIFATSNRIYLDIRNHYNRGLNYYRNFGADVDTDAKIKLRKDPNSSTGEMDYGTDKWPILIIDTTQLTGSGPKTDMLVHLPKGNVQQPVVSIESGYYRIDYPVVSKRLRHIFFETSGDYTVEVALSTPKVNANTVVPYYINLRYFDNASNYVQKAYAPASLTRIDNAFELSGLIDANGLIFADAVNAFQIVQKTSSENESILPTGDPNNLITGPVAVVRDNENSHFMLLRENDGVMTFNIGSGQFSFSLKDGAEFKIIKRSELAGSNTITYLDSFERETAGICSNSYPIDFKGDNALSLSVDNSEISKISDELVKFTNTYDKRLVLKNPQTQDGITQYNLAVQGYKLDSVNNTVSLIHHSTGIPVSNKAGSPVFYSDLALANIDEESAIDKNRDITRHSYIGATNKTNIRSSAQTGQNIKVKDQGAGPSFSLLGKKLVSPHTWYYVQWYQKLKGPNNNTVNPGNGWIRQYIDDNYTAALYPVVNFDKFIDDLIDLQQDLNIDTASSGDSLELRTTRIRQLTKESDGGDFNIAAFFDSAIGSTTPDPVKRLQHIPYDNSAGNKETINGITLDTNLQLFKDYMGVRLSNGTVLDLHHLFIGLDVLNHQGSTTVNVTEWVLGILPFSIEFKLDNNVTQSTWAGDIGAAVGDYVSNKRDGNAKLSFNQEYSAKAPDHDLFADMYAHYIHNELIRLQALNPGFKELECVLQKFDRDLQNGAEEKALKAFFEHIGASFNTEMTKTSQSAVHKFLSDEIYAFSLIWFGKGNQVTAWSDYPNYDKDIKDDLREYADKGAEKFMKLLEKQRKKFAQ